VTTGGSTGATQVPRCEHLATLFKLLDVGTAVDNFISQIDIWSASLLYDLRESGTYSGARVGPRTASTVSLASREITPGRPRPPISPQPGGEIARLLMGVCHA
jgi:hypothetical protein